MLSPLWGLEKAWIKTEGCRPAACATPGHPPPHRRYHSDGEQQEGHYQPRGGDEQRSGA